jgi:hypothetical protein
MGVFRYPFLPGLGGLRQIFLHSKQKEFVMRKKSVKHLAVAVNASKPKKLSKAGEWLRTHPKGLGVTIYDMRAVMR